MISNYIYNMKQEDQALIELFFSFMKSKNKLLMQSIEKGMALEHINQILNQFNFPVPDVVGFFFTKANGYKKDSKLNVGQSLLFDNGLLMSLPKCLLEYNCLKDIQPELISKLPLFDSGGGDFLLIDCDSRSPTFNHILFGRRPY